MKLKLLLAALVSTLIISLGFKDQIRAWYLERGIVAKRSKIIATLPTHCSQNLIIGNSLVFDSQMYFPTSFTKLGMNGELIKGVTEVLQKLPLESGVDNVFILIGLNNVLNGYSLDQIKQDFHDLFEVCTKLTSKVILIEIPLVCLEADGFFVKNEESNVKIESINEFLQFQTAQKGYDFLPIEKLNTEKCDFRVSDGVHLNEAAYEMLNNSILNYTK